MFNRQMEQSVLLLSIQSFHPLHPGHLLREGLVLHPPHSELLCHLLREHASEIGCAFRHAHNGFRHTLQTPPQIFTDPQLNDSLTELGEAVLTRPGSRGHDDAANQRDVVRGDGVTILKTKEVAGVSDADIVTVKPQILALERYELVDALLFSGAVKVLEFAARVPAADPEDVPVQLE